jgi:hypothetical protein
MSEWIRWSSLQAPERMRVLLTRKHPQQPALDTVRRAAHRPGQRRQGVAARGRPSQEGLARAAGVDAQERLAEDHLGLVLQSRRLSWSDGFLRSPMRSP